MTTPYNAAGANGPSFFTRQNMAYIGFALSVLLVIAGGTLWLGLGLGLFSGGLLLAVFSYLLGNDG